MQIECLTSSSTSIPPKHSQIVLLGTGVQIPELMATFLIKKNIYTYIYMYTCMCVHEYIYVCTCIVWVHCIYTYIKYISYILIYTYTLYVCLLQNRRYQHPCGDTSQWAWWELNQDK